MQQRTDFQEPITYSPNQFQQPVGPYPSYPNANQPDSYPQPAAHYQQSPHPQYPALNTITYQGPTHEQPNAPYSAPPEHNITVPLPSAAKQISNDKKAQSSEFSAAQIKDNTGPFMTGVVFGVVPFSTFIPFFQKYSDRKSRRYLLAGAASTAFLLFILGIGLYALRFELQLECIGDEIYEESRFNGLFSFDFTGCMNLDVLTGVRIVELMQFAVFTIVQSLLRAQEKKESQQSNTISN